jgi:hypothetical protein
VTRALGQFEQGWTSVVAGNGVQILEELMTLSRQSATKLTNE